MKHRAGTSGKPASLARECDQILKTKTFRDYPGARNGLQVTHGRQVKKIGWAVDVAIYSSHLPLDAHPELGNSIELLKALGLEKWKKSRFGKAMGKEIGYRVEGGRLRLRELVRRLALLRFVHAGRVGSFEGLEGATLFRFGHVGRVGGFEGLKNIKDVKVRRYESVKVVGSGPKVCQKIGIVTGGFGDLDQVVKAGLDTLITGEADYPTEVKAWELGINLILGGHRETEVFGVRELAALIRLKM